MSHPSKGGWLFYFWYMLARIRFLLFYYLFWVIWFQLARLLFLVYNLNESKGLTLTEKALSFLYGLRMDLSVAAYFLMPVCLFVIGSVFIPFFRKPLIYSISDFSTISGKKVNTLANQFIDHEAKGNVYHQENKKDPENRQMAD